MQKTKQVNVAGRAITLKEIRVRDIIDFQPELTKLTEGFSFKTLLEVGEKLLFVLSDLRKEEIPSLSFSEIDELEIAFKDLNSPFLKRFKQGKELGVKLGLQEVLEKVILTFRTELVENLKGLEKPLENQSQIHPNLQAKAV